ncbi:hypothetical protein [Piscinibacter gummiphilus]|uniref:Uncharacterized protein n=1 Tax=Piscinibacter gummiphilus TaxID=946333 RepID=A0A1W6LAZ2_9BURK|nr:hypothetical protein [Piscinibacter gummiphilus]ARN21413.1 hypothetical protein A4W93_16745 [Piscinibacter gummiphilus]GLS96237.1 hypothetical protein GCM10007918_35290 [Piscinibacter gummiphilus]
MTVSPKSHSVPPIPLRLPGGALPWLVAAAFLLLLAWPVQAHAASVFNGFPLVDDVLCGFFAYSRTKLAPMIAGIVLVFSVVGHWLGSGKMWSTMLYVGLGLGIVLGAGSALASYTGVAASCIAS